MIDETQRAPCMELKAIAAGLHSRGDARSSDLIVSAAEALSEEIERLRTALATAGNDALERAAEEARLAIYQTANQKFYTKTLGLRRDASCVDYAKAAAIAIRALMVKKEAPNAE